MANIKIHNLGPINDCEMVVNNFTVLTGTQASGKSTIAKAVFFCRTVKDDIYETITKKALLGIGESLFNDVIKVLRNKFLQLFGTSKAMKRDMELVYYYDQQTYIRVSLKMQEGIDFLSPNFVWIDFSKNITEFLRKYSVEEIESATLRKQINGLFCDEYEVIFIPAGRSLITLLTSQLNYLFATMDDEQKRSIDFGTQKYIERILKIRPLFSEGVDGLITQKANTPGTRLDFGTIKKMLVLIHSVLKGKYVYKDGEERLYIDDEHFVKINYTSSGQQETVWIFNILLHLLINNSKAFIILEEPEAHLYPDAQKSVVDILALITNKSCGILLTTHSPYILGALNNLIYAGRLSEKEEYCQNIKEVVDELFFIDNCNSYFLEHGSLQSCIGEDDGLIINEVIDGASVDINSIYDELFDIEYNRGE